MATKIITAKQQERSAQSFAFFCCIVTIIPVLLPFWIAASIFAYCAIACHPNKRVQAYLTKAGHRFYGLIGGLVVVLNFSPQMAKWVGGAWHLALIIWLISILVVVPLGVRDILRAKKEPWQDMAIEDESAS